LQGDVFRLGAETAFAKGVCAGIGRKCHSMRF